MKKYAGAFCLLAIVFSSYAYGANTKEINEKVMQAFKKTFPLAEKVNWQEFTDRYMVNFEESNIRVVVDYDKDGNYLSSKRYYQEDNLPINVLYKIKKKYSDKKIFGITEISNELSTEFYVKLEDDKYFTTVKVDADGRMEVVEKFEKQN